MFILVSRKRMVKEFAEKIAAIQKKADKEYYKPHLKNFKPEEGMNEHAAWLVDQINPLKELCQKLGIVDRVYTEAYKIYDFRNSGKRGYGLKDGKIEKLL